MLRQIDLMVEKRTTSDIMTNNGNTSYSVERDLALEINCKSGKASCCEDDEPADPFGDIPEMGLECQLDVFDMDLRKVALGRVFRAPTENSRSHGCPFGENELRVSIEVVLEGEEGTQLPLPTEEFSTVGEAVGSFVRWPKSLINIGYPKLNQEVTPQVTMKLINEQPKQHTSEESKKAESGKSIRTMESFATSTDIVKAGLEQQFESRKILSKLVSMMVDGGKSELALGKDVVGYEQIISLTKEGIKLLLNMEKLNLSCIKTFVGYLHSIRNNRRYGFLCPEFLSMIGHNADEMTTYIHQFMNKGRKPIYLAPFYNKDHWVLIILDIVEHNHVYWFDPLGKFEPSGYKALLNTSIRAYGYGGGTRKSTKAPQWVKVDCACQPGNTECGYYIMKYMTDLITSSNLKGTIDKHFKVLATYSQEDIDEVRDLWANYYLQN